MPWGFLMRFHAMMSKVVLGKRLTKKTEEIKVKAAERRAAIDCRVTELEQRTSVIAEECGLVANGRGK